MEGSVLQPQVHSHNFLFEFYTSNTHSNNFRESLNVRIRKRHHVLDVLLWHVQLFRRICIFCWTSGKIRRIRLHGHRDSERNGYWPLVASFRRKRKLRKGLAILRSKYKYMRIAKITSRAPLIALILPLGTGGKVQFPPFWQSQTCRKKVRPTLTHVRAKRP